MLVLLNGPALLSGLDCLDFSRDFRRFFSLVRSSMILGLSKFVMESVRRLLLSKSSENIMNLGFNKFRF